MNSYKQLFVLDMPVKDLFAKFSEYPALCFANTTEGNALTANDRVIEMFGDCVGKNIRDFMLEAEANEITSNNVFTVNNNAPQLFYETGLDKECLSIKGRAYNSCNHIVGVGGLSFYLHQIPLKEIITIINKLVSLRPSTNNFKYSYVANAQKYNMLSPRERECVYYLTRSMTSKESAKAMGISHRTVQTHIEHIKNKLGCYSRADIVSKVFESI